MCYRSESAQTSALLQPRCPVKRFQSMHPVAPTEGRPIGIIFLILRIYSKLPFLPYVVIRVVFSIVIAASIIYYILYNNINPPPPHHPAVYYIYRYLILSPRPPRRRLFATLCGCVSRAIRYALDLKWGRLRPETKRLWRPTVYFCTITIIIGTFLCLRHIITIGNGRSPTASHYTRQS